MKQTSFNPHSVLVHVLKMSMLSIEESSVSDIYLTDIKSQAFQIVGFGLY